MKNVAQAPLLRVTVLCALITALFDTNLNKSTYMKVTLWKQCVDVLNGIKKKQERKTSLVCVYVLVCLCIYVCHCVCVAGVLFS